MQVHLVGDALHPIRRLRAAQLSRAVSDRERIMSVTMYLKTFRFFGAACALAATAARATPVLFDPVLALVDQPTAPRVVALSLCGTGFGTPLAGSSRVVIDNPSLPTLTLSWPVPQLLAWRDTQVIVSVPPAY